MRRVLVSQGECRHCVRAAILNLGQPGRELDSILWVQPLIYDSWDHGWNLGTRLIGLLITVWLAANLSAWTIRDNSLQMSHNKAVSVSITNYVQRSPLSNLCLHKKLLPRPPYIYSPTPSHPPRFFILLMLILGGDVEINPGHGAKSTFCCGYCDLAINWSQKGICCDDCSLWFHTCKTCVDISSGEYGRLSNITVEWKWFSNVIRQTAAVVFTPMNLMFTIPLRR